MSNVEKEKKLIIHVKHQMWQAGRFYFYSAVIMVAIITVMIIAAILVFLILSWVPLVGAIGGSAILWVGFAVFNLFLIFGFIAFIGHIAAAASSLYTTIDFLEFESIDIVALRNAINILKGWSYFLPVKGVKGVKKNKN